MPVYRCAADQFYESMMAEKEYIDKIWGEVENIHETEFFELCKTFSDISLNADKIWDSESQNVKCDPKEEDIDSAKEATKRYIEEWNIQDIDLLLGLIYKMHSEAIEWNDNRQKNIKIYYNPSESVPSSKKYYNFEHIPAMTWDQIITRIKE